jgi:hypothetical protein
MTIDLDGSMISVRAAPPPALSYPRSGSKEKCMAIRPTIPPTKGISDLNDVTQISLRLGASLVDRSERFNTVAELVQALQLAVRDFNEANSNVASTYTSYQAVEQFYSATSPGIPRLMKGMRDSVVTPLTASSSSVSDG